MKIGPLDNKQVGIQQEQAKQAKLERAKSGSVEQGNDSNALNERRRLGELADRKKCIETDRFERSSNDTLSARTAGGSYSKEQLESGKTELVKNRIQDGYYDRKDVVRKVADKMIEKLGFENDDRIE